MAHERVFAAGKNSSKERSMAQEAVGAERVHAWVDAMQASIGEPRANDATTEAEHLELTFRDHPMLPGRELNHCQLTW